MTLEKSVEEVNKGMHEFLKNLSDFELYTPISYLLKLGGKRLRPALALLANAQYNGSLETIIHPALAIEVFHNFSLMHDDIMDKAPLRRGQQTVHQKWNENAAILSGDAMLVQAYQLVLKTNPEHALVLNELFSKTALEVCEGQQLDMDFEERNDVSITEYLEMIRLKTSVLLGCSLKMGAISAGASDYEADLMYDFGLNMGIAFQLRDDFLDAFGETHKVGKQKGGDILANKKTYLALKAFEKANQEQKKTLKSLENQQNSAKKITQTLEIFTSLEVDKDINELAHQFYQKAISALEKTEGSLEVKNELLKFSESLMVREF